MKDLEPNPRKLMFRPLQLSAATFAVPLLLAASHGRRAVATILFTNIAASLVVHQHTNRDVLQPNILQRLQRDLSTIGALCHAWAVRVFKGHSTCTESAPPDRTLNHHSTSTDRNGGCVNWLGFADDASILLWVAGNLGLIVSAVAQYVAGRRTFSRFARLCAAAAVMCSGFVAALDAHRRALAHGTARRLRSHVAMHCCGSLGTTLLLLAVR